MPTIERYRGYRFFFFSNEGGGPPHVHVESGREWAKFWLGPVAYVDSRGYNASQMREIRSRIEEMRVRYLEAWHEHFGR